MMHYFYLTCLKHVMNSTLDRTLFYVHCILTICQSLPVIFYLSKSWENAVSKIVLVLITFYVHIMLPFTFVFLMLTQKSCYIKDCGIVNHVQVLFLQFIACNYYLPFLKIFSNFVHFCPNFQIFCLFFTFFLENHTHAFTF